MLTGGALQVATLFFLDIDDIVVAVVSNRWKSCNVSEVPSVLEDNCIVLSMK